MFNAFSISTLKFRFEKNDKINNITSAMLNDYIILTLKFEKKNSFRNSKNLKKKWKN